MACSFLSSVKYESVVWMCHSLSIPLLKGILAIMNKVARHICVQVLCGCKFSAPLGKIPRDKILNHMIRVHLETAKLSSTGAILFVFPPAMKNKESLLLHILAHIWYYQHSGFFHFNRCGGVLFLQLFSAIFFWFFWFFFVWWFWGSKFYIWNHHLIIRVSKHPSTV